ncbi:MAG TPA: sigma-70 family RNA polymerase sigma factor [Terriglobales bacterium]
MDPSEDSDSNGVSVVSLVAVPDIAMYTRLPQEQWGDWIRAAADGDQSALAQLYDSTKGIVYGLILRIVENAATAEDVALEVYLQVWRQARTYDPSRGTALGWIVTLARSRAIDAVRSKGMREFRQHRSLEAVNAADAAAGPEESSALAQRRHFVTTALQTLPAEQRRAIELAFFSGMSHTEIAEFLELPLGTIKTRVRLGMARLRDALRAYAEKL